MKLTEFDKQIFVTALNKLDNPRCKELIHDFILNGKFLENQEKAENWDTCLELGKDKKPEDYLGIARKCLDRELEKDQKLIDSRKENKQLKESDCIKAYQTERSIRESTEAKYEIVLSDYKQLKEIVEKATVELQRRIDEETTHINHPKQIYRTVQHNCGYNLRVCEILKEFLGDGKEE